MPEPTKFFLSESMAIIVSNKDRQRTFVVPKAKAEGFIYLIEEFEVNDRHHSDGISFGKYTRPGAVLRGARLRKEFTQQALANQLGIAQNHISAMEYGKRPIGKKMAQRLAEALHVNYRIFL